MDLADGDDYVLAADKQLDPEAGWCQAVQTQKTFTLDTDGDGVRDNVDECDHVEGDGTSTDGCPLVEREFTDITYAGGVVSGTLRVKTSETGGCTAANDVSVTPTATGVALSGEAAQGTGAFEVAVDLADGDEYVLAADKQLDPAAGWCQADPDTADRSRSTPMATASGTTWTPASRGRVTGRRPMGVRWSSGSSPTSPTPGGGCRAAEGEGLRERAGAPPANDVSVTPIWPLGSAHTGHGGPGLRPSFDARGGPVADGELYRPGRGRVPRSHGRLVRGGSRHDDPHARHR